MSVQLIFICAAIGAMAVSQGAGNLLQRAAALLDPRTRQRIDDRETGASFLWRLPDIVGAILIVCGILKAYRIVRLSGALDINGMVLMACGLALVCLAGAARSWHSWHSYRAEAPGTSASVNALAAALLISAAELALSGGVCWYVFTHLPNNSIMATTHEQAGKRQQTVRESGDTVKISDEFFAETPVPAWVDQAEALRLLNKPAWYLEALAERQDIRTRKAGAQHQYLRDDIVKGLAAGLPSEAELKRPDAAQPAGK